MVRVSNGGANTSRHLGPCIGCVERQQHRQDGRMRPWRHKSRQQLGQMRGTRDVLTGDGTELKELQPKAVQQHVRGRQSMHIVQRQRSRRGGGGGRERRGRISRIGGEGDFDHEGLQVGRQSCHDGRDMVQSTGKGGIFQHLFNDKCGEALKRGMPFEKSILELLLLLTLRGSGEGVVTAVILSMGDGRNCCLSGEKEGGSGLGRVLGD